MSAPPRRARRGPRWWARGPFLQYLPRNAYTPAEVADALELLSAHADPGCERMVTITWCGVRPTWRSLRRSRHATIGEVRAITEPERVRKITLNWSYPPTPGGGPSRVKGRVVHRLGRGRLGVEQGGWAREDFNRCAASLAQIRPARASLADWVIGWRPYLGVNVLLLAVAWYVYLVGGPLSSLQSLPPWSWTLLAIAIYGIYYLSVRDWIGGTRLVVPARVAGRTWLTPVLIATIVQALIALLALGPPTIELFTGSGSG